MLLHWESSRRLSGEVLTICPAFFRFAAPPQRREPVNAPTVEARPAAPVEGSVAPKAARGFSIPYGKKAQRQSGARRSAFQRLFRRSAPIRRQRRSGPYAPPMRLCAHIAGERVPLCPCVRLPLARGFPFLFPPPLGCARSPISCRRGRFVKCQRLNRRKVPSVLPSSLAVLTVFFPLRPGCLPVFPEANRASPKRL